MSEAIRQMLDKNLEVVLEFLMPVRLISVAIVIVVAFVLWKIIRKYIKKSLDKTEEDEGKKQTIIRLTAAAIRDVIILFVIVIVLQIYGVNVTSMVAGLGVIGIVVGLALQDIMKDFIMGFNILWSNFYSIGDVIARFKRMQGFNVIQYQDVVGTVVHFDIKITKIEDLNTGNLVTVSNRNITQIQKISDWQDIFVSFAYGVPLTVMEETMDTLIERIGKIPEVKECSKQGTDELADSSINMRLRLFSDPGIKGVVRRKAVREIQILFEEKGLEIPFKQMDVHVVS